MNLSIPPLGQKHSELLKAFELVSGFINQLPVVCYHSRFINNAWVVQSISDGITRLLGYKKEDIIGKKGFHELVLDNEFYTTLPLESDQSTDKFSFLYALMTAQQTPKRVIDKGIFLFGPSGQLVGSLGILMDYTLESDFDILDHISFQLPTRSEQIGSLEQIIYSSATMKKVVDRILKIANTNGHVLIQGESGTGKELTARAIHESSKYGRRSFIAINCGAISEHLIESEFFGHVKGAFSGANEKRKGYLDVVNHGTLFLDEVGEMPINMQIKLLRVLDGYGYTPVGGTKEQHSQFRLICATNRKLEQSIAAGLMRLDFYHRIKQLTVTLPPLRDRQEDLLPLIRAFAERYYNDNRLPMTMKKYPIPEDILEKFKAYHWPGNIRELHHAVIKYLSFGEVDFTEKMREVGLVNQLKEHLEVSQGAPSEESVSYSEYEKRSLLKVLNQCHWDTKEAARILNKTQRTIQRKIARYKLK